MVSGAAAGDGRKLLLATPMGEHFAAMGAFMVQSRTWRRLSDGWRRSAELERFAGCQFDLRMTQDPPQHELTGAILRVRDYGSACRQELRHAFEAGD